MLQRIFRGRHAVFAVQAAHWLPFVLGLGVVGSMGLSGRLGHGLEFLLGLGLLGAGWFAARRLWPLALVTLAFMTPLAWQLVVVHPRTAAELSTASPGSHLRIRGVIRAQAPRLPQRGRPMRLLLGEAQIVRDGRSLRLLEVEVVFPASGRRRRPFAYGAEIRLGGPLQAVTTDGSRLRVELQRAGKHMAARPISTWRGETLRMALRHRAGYYLSEPALAVYLPIVLGVRERGSPEAREVVASFRRVGISHLFAISGLHIGLLLLIFLAAAHMAGGVLLRHQGRLWGRSAVRTGAVALIWAYLALIGFPVPAVRAAVMASMFLWSGLWGTRTPPLYLLWLAGLILVIATPSIVYSLSFQLSFLSFFFLLAALQLLAHLRVEREAPPSRPWLARSASLAGMNLSVTLAITVGIWPLVAIHFGQISLLVFLGNLLMIPLLSMVVLPGGLVALLVSMAHLEKLPGGWMERIVFGALEGIMQGWLWLIRLIEGAGAGLIVPVELDWDAREIFFYYALLGGAILLLWQMGSAARAKFFFNRRDSSRTL